MLNLQEINGALGTSPEKRSIGELLKYGIAVIDKPIGPTSHEVAAFVRKILNLNKVGHTGTLDFNVSGVLVVLLEESRKVANYFRADKSYVCLMHLSKSFSIEQMKSAFSNFEGEIYQRPPLKSAVAKKMRVRKVHELKIIQLKGKDVLFECRCEAGTYIRKIVSDLGEVLGVKAEMLELRRTSAGNLSEKNAATLQKLKDYYWLWREKGNDNYLRKAILPVEEIEMKRIFLKDESIKKLKFGIRPKVGDVVKMDEGLMAHAGAGLFSLKGELIGMGEPLFSSNEIERMFKTDKKEEIVARISRIIHPL